ncbi:hypothetical protein D1007_14869 [Hordeum vulgare]|nr:hypothetical protein D1007_14869 [Hordeum vulgare]
MISFGGGSSESLGFTFSTGASGNRREVSSHDGSTEGIGGNEGTIGYRGSGYNPNFSHADEYPPSQEAVRTQRQHIDLNVLSNKETRRQYRIDDMRHIMARNGTGNRLKHGVSKAVALACKCPRRIVQRVWQQAKKVAALLGLKMKEIRRIMSELKPALTAANEACLDCCK